MRIVEPLNDPQWDNKLSAWSGATVFHTSAWARVLRDSYGFRPLALCEFDDTGFHSLLPIMEVRSPLTGCRAISLPFSDYCEPYFPDSRKGIEAVVALAPLARERGWKSCEIRGGDRYFGTLPTAAVFSLHTLDLSLPEDELFHAFKESAGRNIRKASREGVSVVRDSSLASLRKFYELHCFTRREHGLPPQPFSFFRNLHEHLLQHGIGDLFLANFKGRPVAGAVFFRFGSRVVFKYGASDRQLLSHRPNDLVMWEAIKWYASRGCAEMCLGRTELAHFGLRRFKAKWGSVERSIGYYRYEFGKGEFVPTPPPAWGKATEAVVRHLPLALNRLLGSLLYRHVA